MNKRDGRAARRLSVAGRMVPARPPACAARWRQLPRKLVAEVETAPDAAGGGGGRWGAMCHR